MKRLPDILTRLPVWCVSLALAGCPDNPAQLCDGDCPLGQVCDYQTGQCVDAPPQPYEGPLPGRFAQVVERDGKIFYAGVTSRPPQIIAGTLGQADKNITILTPITRERPIRLTSSGSRVSLVWLGDDNRFQFASLGNDEIWTFGTVEADVVYAGTQEFTAAHDDAGGLHIAFQATDRTLKALSTSDIRTVTQNIWTLQLVDGGGPTSNGATCPDALRGTGRPGGVGIEPSIVAVTDDLWVAYQDADCGDLRLARRVDGTWSVDLVDAGSLDATPVEQRGRTGRWSSIAVGPAGRIGIAYQDELRGVLKYAATSGQTYEIETVDDGYVLDVNANQRKDLVGGWAELKFDARGAPTIVYMNQSNADLRLAQRPQSGTRWVQRTLSTDGIVGFHAGLVELPTGRLVVAEKLDPVAGSNLVEVWE